MNHKQPYTLVCIAFLKMYMKVEYLKKRERERESNKASICLIKGLYSRRAKNKTKIHSLGCEWPTKVTCVSLRCGHAYCQYTNTYKTLGRWK